MFVVLFRLSVIIVMLFVFLFDVYLSVVFVLLIEWYVMMMCVLVFVSNLVVCNLILVFVLVIMVILLCMFIVYVVWMFMVFCWMMLMMVGCDCVCDVMLWWSDDFIYFVWDIFWCDFEVWCVCCDVLMCFDWLCVCGWVMIDVGDCWDDVGVDVIVDVILLFWDWDV